MSASITPAAAEAWKAAGVFIDWQGHHIFVRRAGDMHAPALLLLHGFPTSSLDWSPLWDELIADHWVIAPDFLGFGFSDKPPNFRYSVNAQANLVEDMVIKCGARNVHVIAHDYGVSIAQELLARMHESTRRLRILSCCFLNGGLLANQHRPRPMQKWLSGRLGPLLSRLMNRDRFARSFSEVFGPDTTPSDDQIEAWWQVICCNGGHRMGHKLLHYMADRNAKAARWSDVLVNLKAPLALINGSVDPVSGDHVAEAVSALNPRISIARLERIGHYPHVEAPDLVRDAYRAFRVRCKLQISPASGLDGSA